MSCRLPAGGWITVFLTATGIAAETPEGATRMEGITAPAVSADGKRMVFEWLDDLWTASTAGGEAVRVEENPARDTDPQFTPDGKRIVFSSDRTGSMQVFSIPTHGGETIRHTHQSEGNELESISPDGSHALVRGLREQTGSRATSLMAINLTRDEREQRFFNATGGDGAAWSPDGKRLLFCRGGEQPYRKGYRGSRASQIWQFEIPSGTFTPLITENSESRSPAWLADGQGFSWISAETGTLNLWSKRFADPTVRALTTFTGDGVFMRQSSADGSTFVLQRGSQLFRFQPQSDPEPRPLLLWTQEKLPDVSRFETRISTTTDADFTADLQQTVFASHGELWCIRCPGGKTERLTETSSAESDVVFSPSGEWLYFQRDHGLESEWIRAKFQDGKLADARAIVRGPRSKCRLTPSPDGRRIAWVEGTGDVFTAKADGSETRRIFPCWDLPTLEWSPDGNWLTIAAQDPNANRDIWLAAADGHRLPVNLTRNPAFEGSPRWSPDGRRLVFSARRDEAGRMGLWQIDFGRNGLAPDITDAELQGLGDRAKKMDTGDREPIRTIWSADSKSVWFQNKTTSDKAVYSVAVSSGEIRTVAELRGDPVRMTRDGTLVWRTHEIPALLKGGTSVDFPISAVLERHRPEVMELAFRRIWRTLGERFHDRGMNGTDWPAIREKYEGLARESRTSRQFERVINQLLGELNASHLTFSPTPWANEIQRNSKENPDACPGLVFRDGGQDGPLTIERVIPGSPAALLKDPPLRGETVVRIGGEPVTHLTPLHRFFQDADGRSLPWLIRSADGAERVLEVRCISYRQARALERRNRDAIARETVADAGKFCYIAVPDMSIETFRSLELRVYRESLTSEGMILDLRNNGGGREADRMLSLFCQPVHSFTVPRDGPRGYPSARWGASARWDKPLVVLCNENTFSNAEIFCHAMQETGRAPLVGTATAGGVISAVEVTIPDAGELQVPFRGWFQTKTEGNCDLHGAKPDHPVDLTPADENAGIDPQLEKAVKVLEELPKG